MTLRPLTLIGIIVSIVTGTSLGVLLHLYTDHRHNPQAAAKPAATLSEALRHVAENYVEEVDQTELMDNAIDGMMRSLDDHSSYLNSSAFDALEANTRGEFGGIGIELGLVDGFFTVITPMDETPAYNAGIQAGDRITALDGQAVKGKKLMDIVHTLRGEPGSAVTMRVVREGEDEPLEFNLERAVIHLESVRSRQLEPGYGYLRISQFQTNTAQDVEIALGRLEQEVPLQGLILDLRNNPGGTLQASVQVADQFLDKGLIVYTEGRLKSSYAKYRATRGDLLAGAPIVVLINHGSASASEIVAGALQDHGRATLVGSKSFGKGSVQSVVPLASDQALKITTAHYFTPNGRSIHNKGIEPDVPHTGEDEAVLAQALEMLKLTNPEPLQARLD